MSETDDNDVFVDVRCDKVFVGQTKTGNKRFDFKLRILTGQRSGETLTYFRPLTPKTRTYIERDMDILGVDPETLKCSGTACRARIGIQEFNGKEGVKGVYAAKKRPSFVDEEELPV